MNTQVTQAHCYRMQTHSGKPYIYYPLLQSILIANPQAINLIENKQEEILLGDCSQYAATCEFLNARTPQKEFSVKKARSSFLHSHYMGTSAILLPTTNCNLRCGYCYSSGGVRHRTMKKELARGIIDMLIRNAIISKIRGRQASVDLGFLGDGEPTFNWEVLTDAVGYLREKASREKLHTSINIATNLAFSEEKAKWISANIDSISASFDGIPEIQNLHRPIADGSPSFETCCSSIKILNENSACHAIRMTVTKESVDRLADCVEFCFREFPKTRSIQIEPMFISSLGRVQLQPPEAGQFIENMRKARAVAREYNGHIACSLSDLKSRPINCGGGALTGIFVTPEGYATSCTEVTDSSDPRWEQYLIGKWNEDTAQLEVDEKQIKRILAQNAGHWQNPECDNCFMRWHCGGGCPAKSGYKSAWCTLSKELTADILDEYAEGTVKGIAEMNFVESQWNVNTEHDQPVIFKAIALPNSTLSSTQQAVDAS